MTTMLDYTIVGAINGVCLYVSVDTAYKLFKTEIKSDKKRNNYAIVLATAIGLAGIGFCTFAAMMITNRGLFD